MLHGEVDHIYTSNIAAGLAVGQFTRWLRGLPVDAVRLPEHPDLRVDLRCAPVGVTAGAAGGGGRHG